MLGRLTTTLLTHISGPALRIVPPAVVGAGLVTGFHKYVPDPAHFLNPDRLNLRAYAAGPNSQSSRLNPYPEVVPREELEQKSDREIGLMSPNAVLGALSDEEFLELDKAARGRRSGREHLSSQPRLFDDDNESQYGREKPPKRKTLKKKTPKIAQKQPPKEEPASPYDPANLIDELDAEYIAQLARRDGLAVGSEPVEIDDAAAEVMSQYQSPLVYQTKSLNAYENSFISPITHMIYEPMPAGEFFFWPQEVESLALFLINEAGYEHIRKPWHPNRFISGRGHLLGREEFEMYGRTCPSHPTRPKSLPNLPFLDERMKLHPAIPQEKHVSTIFGILHMGPFTESLVQDYIDEGAMMAVLNRFSHNALLLNNVSGRPESSAFHFKRMPNPGEPLFVSATVEYSPNKDKALICAGVFDSDLDGSYMDAKSVFKIQDPRELSDGELEFIERQTLPSLVQLKHDLKKEPLQSVGSKNKASDSPGFFSGLFTKKD